MSASREIVDYVATSTGLCLECSGDLAPGFLVIQIVFLLIGAGIAIFDTYTDWELVLQFRERGFNHPLLPIDVNWLRAWYIFAIIGTLFTTITITNESLDVLHSMWQVCRTYCCKSRRRYETTNGKVQEKGRRNDLEMSTEGVANHRQESEKKREEVETDDKVTNDACSCCYRHGWNFTTRAETLASITLWFQDVPMLTLAVLYAFSQSTCKLPERRDVTGDLFNVGLSAIASTLAVAYRLARSMMRLFTSIAVRIKSKKETSKMGKYGKCCSRLLPERGDAVYPQDTCAQCCIIPYYISLIFDFVLVIMGAIISLAIWINYLSLRRAPNFDDSLAIFRFTADGDHVHLLNISNNIIPSNGSHISFETISDPDTGGLVYCLSEFQYREEDFDIFFNTIEVQAVSDEGNFCALKSGSLVADFSTFSRCTLYYTHGGFVLFYGSTNRFSGEITRFDDECIVLKDRLPLVHAGPDLDLSIRVENNINRVHLPDTNEELLILYVNPLNNNTIMFYVSVADIVAAGLDKTYHHTFQDPVNGSNITCLIRFQYNYAEAQFVYNMMRVDNFPPPTNQVCTCAFFGLQFHQTGVLTYGFLDAQAGFLLLLECSEIPLNKLIPQFNILLPVDCSSLC